MAVLSIGLTPDPEVTALAAKIGVGINGYGFADTSGLTPVQTSRPGIYVCGAFQEPKDIPHSVMEASAAAACATELLADAPLVAHAGADVAAGERFFQRAAPHRCLCMQLRHQYRCVADVPAVREYARTLPHVVHVEDNLFSCSQDAQVHIKEVIVKEGINRVVVASCSPRTHEPLFQETIREVGLNKYLFEMANIRDQNTWVHMNNPDKATAKAKDLVRMAVAKAAHIEAPSPSVHHHPQNRTGHRRRGGRHGSRLGRGPPGV